ncbi:polysaccharide deacetylase family protein [Sphaerisporangium flaviroseum]|uniref:polysaccharide deacetylase family protein n=1 Tax=Sphaerisporangium flaviroseum TaxID=509199 RepID=UPI0031E53CA6
MHGVTAQVATAARALNLSVIGWNVDASDAGDSDPEAVARRAVDRARPGSIILMHEGGPATITALPAILRGPAAHGYALVTVPELFGSRGLEPGRVYDAGIVDSGQGSEP